LLCLVRCWLWGLTKLFGAVFLVSCKNWFHIYTAVIIQVITATSVLYDSLPIYLSIYVIFLVYLNMFQTLAVTEWIYSHCNISHSCVSIHRYSFSIQFNFICIAPNHNIHYLKALYRVRSRPYFVKEKNPTVPTKSKRLATGGRKNSLLTGRNLQQNRAQGGRPSASTGWV